MGRETRGKESQERRQLFSLCELERRPRHPSGRWSVLTNPIAWVSPALNMWGVEGGSGTSCLSPDHSLETSLRAEALTQAPLPGDWGQILKSLEENKQVMGKVDPILPVFVWTLRTFRDMKGASHVAWNHVTVEVWAWHLLVQTDC